MHHFSTKCFTKSIPGLHDLYDEQLNTLSDSRDQLRQRAADLQTRLASAQPRAQVETIEWLRQFTIEEFWTLDNLIINRALYQILRNQRFFVEDGAIIGLGYSQRVPGGKRQSGL